MLHLKTFGGLSVDIDGVPASGAGQQRKTLALLALLAAAGNRGMSRDKLISLLWPDTDAEHGKGLLKQACYALRRDLHARDLFLGSIQLHLNPTVIASDVDAFGCALREGDTARAISCYTAAFLDGFYLAEGGEFEAWAETERARLAGQCRTALEALAVEATRRGEHRDAADWWRRLLELDRLSAHAALGLMTALEQAGEPAEALRRGQAYAELLRAELGADPPPELSQWIERHRHAEGNGTGPSNYSAAAQPAPADRLTGIAAQAPSALAAGGSRRSLVAVGGLILVAAVVISLLRGRADAPTDPNLLVIAPFDVLDPSLEIWHEGLVDILSRDLDGAGPLRTVPQTVGLKRWRGRADRVSAESFGRRTGAGLVVFGSVGRTRDSVRLRATLLDLARQRVEPDLEVRGELAAMGDLADSLGFRILQMLGRDRPIGAVRRVSIGARSLPALKAFLLGEQFYRRGLWDSALVYYDRAITQDTSFALAYRHMRQVLDWHPSSSEGYRPTREYFLASVRLNHGLSPKDSMMIVADSFLLAADDASDPEALIRYSYRSLATLEEAARRYPDDPEVWYELGDARFHLDRPFAGDPAPALEAFDHAIALDSGFAPAYEHTVELAINLNRSDRARQYAGAYLRLDPTDVNAQGIRLTALLLDPERAHTAEAERMIDSVSAAVLLDAATGPLKWWADTGETEIRLLRTLAHRGGIVLPGLPDTLMNPQYLAYGLASRGHLDEAYAVDRRLLLDPDASRFSRFYDPFLNLSLLGAIPDSLAAATFELSLDPGAAWPMPPITNARQLRGLPWWLARGDTVSLARFALRAGQEARSQASAQGKLRSRYLQAAALAYLALARADSVAALRLLQAIPESLCLLHFECYYSKLTEARLLDAAGQTRQAGAVLDRWIWRSGGPQRVLGVLQRGRIAEALGERQKAMDAYQFVVNIWRHADPELQPYVREARGRLERLVAER